MQAGSAVGIKAISHRNGCGVARVVRRYIFYVGFVFHVKKLSSKNLVTFQVNVRNDTQIHQQSAQQVPFQTSFGFCRL